MDKYNAMLSLQTLIGHTEAIRRVSSCFFEGRPLRLNIVYR